MYIYRARGGAGGEAAKPGLSVSNARAWREPVRAAVQQASAGAAVVSGAGGGRRGAARDADAGYAGQGRPGDSDNDSDTGPGRAVHRCAAYFEAVPGGMERARKRKGEGGRFERSDSLNISPRARGHTSSPRARGHTSQRARGEIFKLSLAGDVLAGLRGSEETDPPGIGGGREGTGP